MKFLLVLIVVLVSGCGFPDDEPYDSLESDYGPGLNPFDVPEDCKLRKMFVFKVVCDQGANIFGIDHSFVDGVCQSELDLLEGMPFEKAFHFLNERAKFFALNIYQFHEYTERPIYRNMNGVTITPIIKSEFSEETTCYLNGGRDQIVVNAEVYPYCNDGEETYNYNRCGVQISDVRITNNGAVIQHITMPEDTISPVVGYKLDSGFIYKNFKPAKKNSMLSSGYYSKDPHEQNIYMQKDSAQFLDKYR